MIDGFVLIAPLIFLVILLLFVFVGCGLPTSGTGPSPAYLQIGPGSFANVQTVTTTFTFVAGSLTDSSGPLVLTHDVLDPDNPNSYVVFSSDLLHQDADVTCTCVLALTPPANPIQRTMTVSTDGAGVAGAFRISGEEFGFPLDLINIQLSGGL
jgi:hypothetical protein